MLAIAECPCLRDFISVGVRLMRSKRSIGGTALTTDTSSPRGTDGGLYILRLDEPQAEWELTMFKGARAQVRKDRA